MGNRLRDALSALAVLAGISLLGLMAVGDAHADTLSPYEARAIAKEATIYGFPLVDNYRIQYSYFVDRENPEYKAPWNTLNNVAGVFTPDDKAIQTPNSDTPYSFLGADLRAEPIVITVPAVEKDRYYSLQFIDMYTHNFAYVGSRATGNEAGSYLLTGPRWTGETPKGVKAVIRSETDYNFVLYRTQLKNPADIEAVKAVQAGYKVQTLSQFLGTPSKTAPDVVFVKPLTPEEQRTSPEFFNILNFVLQFCPTHPSETELMARFTKLGIGGGKKFDVQALAPDIRQAVLDGMADAWKEFAEFKKTEIDTGKRPSSDAFGTREFLKNDYMVRMSGAALGIYGNSKEEALYPAYFTDSIGQPLDATSQRYTMRLAPDQLPPANAFWSVTMYELPSSLLSANPLNRYLINSPMLPGLKKDADGGITLYLQHESPGKDKEANWLPAPKGPFWTVMRLYWPKAEAWDGRWKAPELALAKESGSTGPSVKVTADNFIRAESDLYFSGIVKNGGFGKFDHTREPAPIDKQTVIRLNRDTLYSSAVFDLDAGPVAITLPKAGDRFMSMQVFDEDQYTHAVYHDPGSYALTRKGIGTRYVAVAVRTLVDPSNPEDVKQVHALQDAIKIERGELGKFEVPNWDQASQKKVRDALLILASDLTDTKAMYGSKDEVDPVRYIIGAANGWGANPPNEALYLNITPPKNDGTTIYKLKVKDVPVDGFWSVSVYNAEGYYEPNDLSAYSLNNITAKKGDDGSVAIQFGGCDGKLANCFPIVKGWNYMVRLYRPRGEILDGTWKFPDAEPVN